MVKKIILPILVAVVAAITTGSCRELPLIGDLAGQWQIQSMTGPDGRDITVAERYYCFYRHTAQLTAPQGAKQTANMIYDYPDISLEFPLVSPIWLTDWGVIPPEGCDDSYRGWVERYHIDHLDKKRLVMTTAQGVTITLKKY